MWVTDSGPEWEIDHTHCRFDGYYVRCPLGELLDWMGDDAFIDEPPTEAGTYTAQLYEDDHDRWIEVTHGENN